MKNYINLADVIKDSCVDGPGFRSVVFVQGCEHRCPGCHNPMAQGIGGYLMTPTDLANEIFNNCESSMNNYNGELNVTLSGGEPMLQAKRLVKFITTLKKLHPKLNVWCYTGYTWGQLVQDDVMMKLVKLCDVVVDGRFIQELYHPGLKFKGSANQRIIDVKPTLKNVGMGDICRSVEDLANYDIEMKLLS